jgi:hypothetical protein
MANLIALLIEKLIRIAGHFSPEDFSPDSKI